MAKISSILPANKRITSTDIENERPVRPGAPSFGQPIAQTANPKNEFQKISVSDEELALANSNYGSNAKILGGTNQADLKAAEKMKADLEAVDNVNDAFSGLDLRA